MSSGRYPIIWVWPYTKNRVYYALRAGVIMGAKAAGAYLWALRKHKMSRNAAASHLKTSRSQIERMEYGDGDTLAPTYIAFIRLVGADWNDVADLLLSETATVEEAEQKAAALLSKQQAQ